MNRKKKIIISVTSIFLVLLILVSLTYAYFLTQIKGNTNGKSISVSTADLKLEYGDGNGLIESLNVIPGEYVTGNDGKTFTVENKGNAIVENYGIFLTELVNDLADTSDLVYTLTCVSKNVQTNEVSGTCNGVSSETEFPTNNSLLIVNDIGVGIRHEYRLDVLFKETNTDQSDNMNKTIRAKIDLYALAGTIDIEGTVTGYQNGDYIVVNSAEPKKTIIEETETEGVGYYKVVGLLPDNHTITLYDSENTSKASTTFILNKAQSAGVSGNTITMTDETRSATIDLTFNAGNLTKEISNTFKAYSPFESGTLAYAILESAKTNANGTTFRKTPLTKPAEEISVIQYAAEGNEDVSNKQYSFSSSYQSKYITYGTGYKINETTGLFTLTGVSTCKYNEDACDKKIVGKYIGGTLASDNVSSDTAIPLKTNELVYLYKIITTPQLSSENSSYYVRKILPELLSSPILEKSLSVTPDDYGTSYYFRGAVEDNYVDFAGYCWRIVRIEGDGSVKLVLASKNGVCEISENLNENSALIGKGDYGYDSNYLADYDNSQNRESSQKYKMNVFLNGGSFTSNSDNMEIITYIYPGFSENDKNKLKNEEVCIGDTESAYTKNGILLSDDEKATVLQKYEIVYYNTFIRLTTPKMYDPSLKCIGAKASSSKVFPLTADEIVFAGVKVFNYNNVNNYTPYLYYNAGESRNDLDPNNWWSITPGNYYHLSYTTHSTAFAITFGGSFQDYNIRNGERGMGIRPAVTLKAGTTISGGVGTKSNPYIIN